MPTDPSTDPATATTRRTFLARAAAGGALVTAGAVVGPFGSFLPVAGAQGDEPEELSDAAFAELAIPIELAAVQSYQAAIGTGSLDDAWTTQAREFQSHHQGVADTLAGLLGEEATVPRADADLVAQVTAAIGNGATQEAVLAPLAQLEEVLSATHLAALGLLVDPITAYTVAQVLAVEAQHAALLGLASGDDLEAVTPAKATTDQALDLAAAEPAASDEADATTTTTAGS